jgi:hypothetical protein
LASPSEDADAGAGAGAGEGAGEGAGDGVGALEAPAAPLPRAAGPFGGCDAAVAAGGLAPRTDMKEALSTALAAWRPKTESS